MPAPSASGEHGSPELRDSISPVFDTTQKVLLHFSASIQAAIPPCLMHHFFSLSMRLTLARVEGDSGSGHMSLTLKPSPQQDLNSRVLSLSRKGAESLYFASYKGENQLF